MRVKDLEPIRAIPTRVGLGDLLNRPRDQVGERQQSREQRSGQIEHIWDLGLRDDEGVSLANRPDIEERQEIESSCTMWAGISRSTMRVKMDGIARNPSRCSAVSAPRRTSAHREQDARAPAETGSAHPRHSGGSRKPRNAQARHIYELPRDRRTTFKATHGPLAVHLGDRNVRAQPGYVRLAASRRRRLPSKSHTCCTGSRRANPAASTPRPPGSGPDLRRSRPPSPRDAGESTLEMAHGSVRPSSPAGRSIAPSQCRRSSNVESDR